MKRNMKKLIGMLMLVICLFSLTACGSSEELPNELFYQEQADRSVTLLKAMDTESMKVMVENLEKNFDDFEKEVELYPYFGSTGEKFEYTAEAYLSLFKTYISNLDEFGSYVGVKEYEGGSTNAKNETSYSVVYEFTDHDMRLSLVFDEDNVITSVTADPIYNTAEILEKAALNTLLGMGVVFVVLILICLIISCFGFIPKIEKLFKKEKKAAAPAPAPKAAPAPAAAPAPKAADDLELIAVITAAVAAAMGTTSTDGFVVRSIKRKSNNKWKRV